MLEFPEHSGHLLGLCLELLGPFINYVIQIGGGGGFSQKLTQKKHSVTERFWQKKTDDNVKGEGRKEKSLVLTYRKLQ